MRVVLLALAMSSEVNAVVDDRRKSQDLAHFHNYLTEDEGKVFMDPAVSFTVKINLALDVCNRQTTRSCNTMLLARQQ